MNKYAGKSFLPFPPRLAVGLPDNLNFPRSLSLLLTSPSLSRNISQQSHPKRLISLHNAPLLNQPILSSTIDDPQRAFVDLLKNLSRSTPILSEVEPLHSSAVKSGFIRNGKVGTGLTRLYVKCSYLDLAHKLFDEMCERDALVWTILISDYSRIGQHTSGLSLFSQMLDGRTMPNCFTVATVLKCCLELDDLRSGKAIHGWVLRNGIVSDVVVQNSIMDLYVKCGTFEYAKKVFEMMSERDVVSWNIIIGAHLKIGDTKGSMELFEVSPFRDVSSWNTIINGQMENGCYLLALQLLYQMVDIGPQFNHFTFSTAFTLAGSLSLLELGRQIHNQVLRIGYEKDTFVRSSLIDMYCKCGQMEASLVIFNDSSQRTDGSMARTIQWSSIIAGHVQNGRREDGFALFCKMLQEGVKVDKYTLTSIASACSDDGVLEQGRQVHACIEKLGHGSDSFLAAALTDMYSKCGSLEDAYKIFDSSYTRNVVLWTSMIGSYASHGHGREAIQLFKRMLEEKITPNDISFIGVLSACSHGGLVEDGYKYFRSMQEDYQIVPGIEHFTCVVDLLGRAGLLDEAKDFIYGNNINHHSVVWRALLSACRVHNNVEMAMWASEQLVSLEPYAVGSYVLLSNIYATKSRYMEASKIRSLMQERGVSKEPGRSWIQLKNKVHTFVVGDRSHPEAQELYSFLESLMGRLKEMGYSSRTDLVLHDVDEE